MKISMLSTCILVVMSVLSYATIFAQQVETAKADSVKVLAEDFVSLLSKEDFTAAVKNFDAAVRAALPPVKLEQTWKSLLTQVGSFKSQLGMRTERVQGYDIVFVSCQFEESPLDVKVVFNGAKQIAGLFFVPMQAKPETHAPSGSESPNEKEVVIGRGKWAVPGTLSFPNGTGPFPAVVLVHGSGPNDRDETIGPNKPFRDLARGLASRGIAVLRYDKRTKKHASRLALLKDSLTVKEEVIDDALLAVSLLRDTDRIDPKKIFVLGHSLGGMLVPRIVSLDSHIAGLIIVAGASRPLEDVILEQMTYLFSLGGPLSDEKKLRLDAIRSQVARVKDPTLSPTAPSTELPLGIPAKYWLDLRGYNPPEVARGLKQPMLILQGERDYQVTMEDFAGWKKYLSSQPNVVFKSYPNLNHLFIEGEGKSTPSEYNTPGHVAEVVIDDIAAWTKKE